MEMEEKVPILAAFYSKLCHMNSLSSEERGILTQMHLLSQRNLGWGGQVTYKVTGPFEGFYKTVIVWIPAENVMTTWQSEFYGVKLCLLSNRSILCKLQFRCCLSTEHALGWISHFGIGAQHKPRNY